MVEVGKLAILVIHGPNLNMLGRREPDVYGKLTLDDINFKIQDKVKSHGLSVDFVQTNHEGVMVETIQQAADRYGCIIINAAAFTHYSIAVRDALTSISVPAIEVHLSNIYKREPFRHNSVIAPIVVGQISGFGVNSYLLAVDAAVRLIIGDEKNEA